MPDDATRPEPFTASTDPAALDDLRRRLRATRWPDAPEDAGWSLGTDLDYLRELVAYWADGFDWAAQEAALARLPRFRVAVGGLGIHFVHARAVGRTVLPCRWCSATAGRTRSGATRRSIPLLTDPGAHGGDPADAFDVVVPDMPGYGYSDRPAGAPLELDRRRRAVGRADGRPRLRAVRRRRRRHRQPRQPLPRARPSRSGRGRAPHRRRPARLHRRPGRTVARRSAPGSRTAPPGARPRAPTRRCTAPSRRPPPFGLTDSPAGLAAWIVEKLRAWSDCDGDIERRFTKDEILTNVTIYWLTADDRLVDADVPRERRDPGRRSSPAGSRCRPASRCSAATSSRPPRAWLERTANVVRLDRAPRGGHFAPFEEPELYAAELREFFRPYR